MSLSDAFQLRKQQKFKEATEVYQPLWHEKSDQFTQWDGWSFAYCLFKLKKYDESLGVCRNLYSRFKSFEILNSLYARNIYYTQFLNGKNPGLATLSKATQAIFELSPPYSSFSITPTAIFKLIKYLMAQPQINWKEIEGWLLKMDPDLLNDEVHKIMDPGGKMRELASPLECWYAGMIKAKAGLNEPKQLLEVLQIARRKKIKWHYNNDIWFARKEAFAYKQLGEREKAISILRKLVKQKEDWFLLFDLAQVVPDGAEAMELLCKAALERGKNEMKLGLYAYMYAQIKTQEKLKHEADLVLSLVVALREENNWAVNPDLLTEIEKRGIDINKQGSSSLILKALIPFWQSTLDRENPGNRRKGGFIKTLFPDGNAGFIQSGSKRYFFRTKNIKGQPKVGLKVVFDAEEGFDKKRQKPSVMAIHILIVNNP